VFNISISLSPTKTLFGPLLFAGDLEKGFKIAKELGYDGIELSLLDSNDIDQAWLLEKLRKLNLRVFAIATGQSYYNDGYSIFNFKEDSRLKAIKRLKEHIDLAVKLNSMVIIGGIRGRLSEPPEVRSLELNEGKLALIEISEYAKKKNIILLIEPINRYETNFINTVQEGMELIDELGMDNLKLLPDTFHMNIEEKSIKESLIKAKSFIGYIHFADSNRRAPGAGHVDFKSIMSSLKKINYKNYIGIEILPLPNDYQAAKESIEFLRILTDKKK
jgi:5-keto-L-gluconate epimerase